MLKLKNSFRLEESTTDEDWTKAMNWSKLSEVFYIFFYFRNIVNASLLNSSLILLMLDNFFFILWIVL